MSVTICWRPTRDSDNHFSGGVSSDLEALKEAFPSGTIQRNEICMAVLKGLQASDRRRTFYDDVARIVEEVGEIEFWGEY